VTSSFGVWDRPRVARPAANPLLDELNARSAKLSALLSSIEIHRQEIELHEQALDRLRDDLIEAVEGILNEHRR
jgi:hypothetical protein